MAGKTIIRPYKLKPTGEMLSRDDLSTWKQVLLGHCRQNENWQQFLPNSATHATWKCADQDETNGLNGATAGDTNKLRSAFLDFITCVATFSPTGFNDTILREATSFNWVVDEIKKTFGLETKGESFLGIEDLKFDFDSNFTHQQCFMEIKDFVYSSLKKIGDTVADGVAVTENEQVTYALKNFITREWLAKVDIRLPKYVKETKGHLFTLARPSLADNQRILCDQIPAMLAELDKSEITQHSNVSMGQVYNAQQERANVNMGYVPIQRGGRGGGRFNSGRNFLSRVPFRGAPVRNPGPRRDQGCFRCLEATPVRYDAAKTHQVRDCPWPAQQGLSRPPTRQPNFKVVLFPENDQLQQPQQATVSMGQLGIADQYYDQYYDQYHYSDQYYQPQEDYATASISEDL